MDKIKFFDTLSKRFIYPNNNKLFHKEIEKDKQTILNYYRKEPAYKDKIDKMEMKSRGIYYYKSLVKKQIQKKSNFIKIILKSISDIEGRPKKMQNKNLNKRYNLPILESVRNKKKRLDIKLKSRENSEENINNNSMQNHKRNNLSPQKKNGENSILNKFYSNRSSSINRNRKFSAITNNHENFSTQIKNISHSFSSNTIIGNDKEERLKNLNRILDDCQKEIKRGDFIGGRVEKFTEKFNNQLTKLKKERDNKVDNNIEDQKIVEDKVKAKQKYKIMEIEKFKELKRKLNVKISDNYVYFNRKEYSELANDKRSDKVFDLYLFYFII